MLCALEDILVDFECSSTPSNNPRKKGLSAVRCKNIFSLFITLVTGARAVSFDE